MDFNRDRLSHFRMEFLRRTAAGFGSFKVEVLIVA
jgi:hypothetical protein